MTTTRPKLLEEAAILVRRVIELSRQGSNGHELGQAMGNADGYMRALLLAHLCTSAELLEVVRSERARIDGPALRIEGRERLASIPGLDAAVENHLAAVA